MSEVCTEFIPISEGLPKPGTYLCRIEQVGIPICRVLGVTDGRGGFHDSRWRWYEGVTHYAEVPTLELADSKLTRVK